MWSSQSLIPPCGPLGCLTSPLESVPHPEMSRLQALEDMMDTVDPSARTQMCLFVCLACCECSMHLADPGPGVRGVPKTPPPKMPLLIL